MRDTPEIHHEIHDFMYDANSKFLIPKFPIPLRFHFRPPALLATQDSEIPDSTSGPQSPVPICKLAIPIPWLRIPTCMFNIQSRFPAPSAKAPKAKRFRIPRLSEG
jgi:hypothetical protein